MLFKALFKAIPYLILLILELAIVSAISVIALGVVLFYRPEWILNQGTLRWASTYVLPRFDVALEFKTFEAGFPHLGSYQRKIILHFEGLKVNHPMLVGSWPLLHAEFGIDLSPGSQVLTMIGPITMEKAKVHLMIPPEDPDEPKEPFKWDETLTEKIRKLKWQPLTIDLKELWIVNGKEVLFKGPLAFKLNNDPSNARWKMALETKGVKGTPVLASTLNVAIQLPESPEESFPITIDLDGKATLRGPAKTKLKGRMIVSALDKIRYQLQGGYSKGAQVFSADGSGFFESGRMALNIKGSAKAVHEMLRTVRVDRCRIAGSYSFKGPTLLDTDNSCEIDLKRKLFPEEMEFADLAPDTLGIKIAGPFKLKVVKKKTFFEAFPIRASLRPIENSVYKVEASTVASLSGPLSGDSSAIKSDLKIDAKIQVPKFEALVARLYETPHAIPAPFHTLKGPVRCAAQGSIVNLGEQMRVPLKCQSNLQSEVQALAVDVAGSIQTWLDRKPKIDLDVLLREATLEMPRLKIDDPIPQFLPDSRIQVNPKIGVSEKVAKKPLPIDLAIRVKTPPERPFVVITHIAPTPVPLNINLNIEGDTPITKGEISIQDYEVTFFKREAKLTRLKINVNTEEESPELDGLIAFNNPDFKIQLKLSGTVESPYYILESKPPRNQTELISIILFNGETDDLDEESQRSVEETRSAMVDGAIGLLSMYYLASTPVESVGYNPHTGVFRAKVRLAKGLALTVGSDLEGGRQTVGLRKRLTENWSFETTAETDEETNENKGVALFKWGKRY